MASTVSVLLFATAREAVGRRRMEYPVPIGGLTASQLLEALGRDHPRLRAMLGVSRFVRNGRYMRDLRGRIKPGDEFAIHPPYSGG